MPEPQAYIYIFIKNLTQVVLLYYWQSAMFKQIDIVPWKKPSDVEGKWVTYQWLTSRD